MPGERLLCLDFDNTLVKGHFHAKCAGAKIRPNAATNGVQVMQADGTFLRTDASSGTKVPVPQGGGATEVFVASLINDSHDGPKNPVEMGEEIIKSIANGHKVAVTSYTLYPEVVAQTLKAILETANNAREAKDKINVDEYVKEICVVGGFPTKGPGDTAVIGKEEHIAAAQEYFRAKGFDIPRDACMLVDDSTDNCRVAAMHGPAVLVPKEPSTRPEAYMPKVADFVRSDVKVKAAPVQSAIIAPVQSAPTMDAVIPMVNAIAEQSKMKWEARGKADQMQVVSQLLTKAQADTLKSRTTAGLNAEVFESRSEKGQFRVIIPAKNAQAFLDSNRPMFNPETPRQQVASSSFASENIPPELEALIPKAQAAERRPVAIAHQAGRAMRSPVQAAPETNYPPEVAALHHQIVDILRDGKSEEMKKAVGDKKISGSEEVHFELKDNNYRITTSHYKYPGVVGLDITLSVEQAHALAKLASTGIAKQQWKIDTELAFPQMRDGSLYLKLNDATKVASTITEINKVYGAGACRTSGAGTDYVKIDAKNPNGAKAIQEMLSAFKLADVPKYNPPKQALGK